MVAVCAATAKTAINRLIFIEGVSGVGKTTTASHLHNKLRDMGEAYRCHLEGDRHNPLDPFRGSYPPAIPHTVFTETYVHCWRHFMETHLHQEPGLILDGTLLHHPINDLIRNYRASDEAITTHLTALVQIMQPLNPIVFYLASHAVEQRLPHARESRGQPVLTREQLAFWKNRKRIDLCVLESLPVKSHILNIDAGWGIALNTMMACVIP